MYRWSSDGLTTGRTSSRWPWSYEQPDNESIKRFDWSETEGWVTMRPTGARLSVPLSTGPVRPDRRQSRSTGDSGKLTRVRPEAAASNTATTTTSRDWESISGHRRRWRARRAVYSDRELSISSSASIRIARHAVERFGEIGSSLQYDFLREEFVK